MDLSNKGKNIKIVSIVVSNSHIRLIGNERWMLQTYLYTKKLVEIEIFKMQNQLLKEALANSTFI